MRKILILISFFSLAPTLVVLSVVYYFFVAANTSQYVKLAFAKPKQVSFAALPSDTSQLEETVVPMEAREERVRQFLARYKSPLEPQASFIVETADAYELDYRLIPAIAMQETNLCKKAKENTFNCWGFGVYGKKYTSFDSYQHGIETVTKALSLRYKDSYGLVTPEEIQKVYTPSNDGSWAQSIRHFMAEI